MRSSRALRIALGWWAISAQVANAQSAALRLDVPVQDLADALDQVARLEGVSLLFDRTSLKERPSPALHGGFTIEQALSILLNGTDLAAKRIGPGNYVLVRNADTAKSPDGAIPEILVVGRRTQDTDIRRRADDVQPYRVLTSVDIADAQAGTPDEFLRSRLASNQVPAAAAQQPSAGGKVQSQINLRGLGTAQTLVLIDGRRIASIPTLAAFLQSDVTGLPLAVVDRMETYAGTAGGLYGPGATGGVVNIVTKQDLPRLWIEGQGSINDRGDGKQGRITGGFSVASHDDRTQVSVTASYSKDNGLGFGDRSFVAAARRIAGQLLPVAQNVNVVSADGKPLRLIATLGGQSLGSLITNLPANSGSAGGDESALLTTGAGRFDYRLSADGNGAEQSLLTPMQTSAVLINARQKIGARVEIFGNFLMMTDRGATVTPATGLTYFDLAPGEAGNPFQNPVTVAVSTPGGAAAAAARFRTLRTTIGLIVRLPAKWSLEADAAFGASTDREFSTPPTTLNTTDVFSPGDALSRAVNQLGEQQRYTDRLSDRLHDFNLRIAGPLFMLPGGPVTMTISGEYRDEFSPNLQQIPASFSFDNEHGETVGSILGEARLPLGSQTSPFALLRGLELQLATRVDRYRIGLPLEFVDVDPNSIKSNSIINRGTTLAFTIGAKVVPLTGLTLRGSFATGYQPPSPGDLVTQNEDSSEVVDPKRPNDPVENYVPIITGGSPKLRPDLAKTLSVGFIADPTLLPGLRLSIDYTRILISHEINQTRSGDDAYFIAHEADYPGRIVRAPLTSADIGNGYTGGLIEEIDTGALNSGRSVFQTVDFDLAYARSFPLGRIGVYASASWIPSYRRRGDPSTRVLNYAGQSDGPLNWKGTAGINWHRGSFGVTIDAQYYGGYSITFANPFNYATTNLGRISEQGKSKIPIQTYVDLGFHFRQTFNYGAIIVYRLGIKNILDRTPPLVIPSPFQTPANWPGYSTYGDPRGRRIVLTMTTSL